MRDSSIHNSSPHVISVRQLGELTMRYRNFYKRGIHIKREIASMFFAEM